MFRNVNRVFWAVLINLIVAGVTGSAFAQPCLGNEGSDSVLRLVLGEFFRFMESDFGTCTIILIGLGILVAFKKKSYRVAIGSSVVFWGMVLIKVFVHWFFGMPYHSYADGS